jgi:hypothetical protein
VEVGYPVSRLSLLFFGAAKDVPEAAETVTAGTASSSYVEHAHCHFESDGGATAT